MRSASCALTFSAATNICRARALPNRGTNRGGEVRNRVHQFLAPVGELQSLRAAEGGDFAQVGAGGEELIVARDDEWQSVARQFSDCRGQFQHAGAGQPVGAVRGSELQDAYAVPDL